MIKPIFIVGLPRTGSTLWSNIFDRDNNVMRFGEMHYLNPWHRDIRYFLKRNIGSLQKDENVHKLMEFLFNGRQWEGLRGNYWEQIQKHEPVLLQRRIRDAILQSDRSLGALFRILVDEPTRIRGYERCLIKFPVYISELEQLVTWYPEAKVIHITRDPRATALSKTNDPGGTAGRIAKYPRLRPVYRKLMELFVVIQYRWTSLAHSEHKQQKNYTLFRYEDLLVDPERVIRDLCSFTGLVYNKDMLNPRKGQPSSVTGERRHGFDRLSARRWESGLSKWEARFITWMTRPSMRRLEYDPKEHEVFNDMSN